MKLWKMYMYTVDFRRKLFSVKSKEILSIRGVAKRFDVGTTTITRWTKNILSKKN